MMEKTPRSDSRDLQNLNNGCIKLRNEDYIQQKRIENNRRQPLIWSEATGAQANNARGVLNIGETATSVFRCDQCQKVFTSKSHLKRHTRSHTGDKPHKCKWCGKAFSRKDILNRHLSVHTKHNYDTNCKQSSDNCSQETSEREKENYSKCSQKINTQDMNSTNIFNIDKQNAFRCDRCPKVFKGRVDFLRHIRTHTGEKPHKCSVCGRAFSRKHSLDIHIRTHTGEKPYACSKCKKKFNQGGNLTRHMQRHTDRKIFSCEKCHKRFQSKSSLRDHRSAHSEAHFPACDISKRRLDGKNRLDGDQMVAYGGTSSDELQREQERHLDTNLHKNVNSPISDENPNELLPASVVVKQLGSSFASNDRLVCQYCSQRFQRRGDLQRHIHEHRLILPSWPQK